MKLNCLIIEDSAVQRMIVARLVNNHPQLNLVGDFSNAIEARNCMAIHQVDLVFLDIEMPVISGFSFLEGLKTKPQIIFVTAKAEYALTEGKPALVASSSIFTTFFNVANWSLKEVQVYSLFA